ncbi:hypothetical protein AP75_13915 [Kaistella haifensis DSM 19056]|uniref:Uncharacterized protein n=1 Tax=Kaistella haifensis DSM 19056 TaxID=1450526 RepID=A0A246B6D7_9FLAO|nr:hypothetical protein AP75_13915 [Kaistella haifensis DSM 19056]
MTMSSSDNIDDISNEIFDFQIFPENEIIAKKMGLIYAIKETVFVDSIEISDKFIVLKKNYY